MTHRRLVARWHVGPYPIDVYAYAQPIDEDDSDAESVWNIRPREIRVHERVLLATDAEAWAVLAHELVHMAMHLLSVDLKDEVEERVCDAVGITIAETLAAFLHPPPREALLEYDRRVNEAPRYPSMLDGDLPAGGPGGAALGSHPDPVGGEPRAKRPRARAGVEVKTCGRCGQRFNTWLDACPGCGGPAK